MRVGVVALVAGLHVLALLVLIRAFAPQWTSGVMPSVVQAFDVPVVPPPRAVEPAPKPAPPRDEGAGAPAGRKARPGPVSAPSPRVAVARETAPPVSGRGTQDSSGAAATGAGAGTGGAGQGTGSGASGAGGGGGGAARAVKIAGDIVSARDYPRATRALRLGSAVTVALTVGAAGEVTACRVLRPSRDPEADAITCRLATQRFRFRPARDGQGRAVASVYGWQQRWFTPGRE